MELEARIRAASTLLKNADDIRHFNKYSQLNSYVYAKQLKTYKPSFLLLMRISLLSNQNPFLNGSHLTIFISTFISLSAVQAMSHFPQDSKVSKSHNA